MGAILAQANGELCEKGKPLLSEGEPRSAQDLGDSARGVREDGDLCGHRFQQPHAGEVILRQGEEEMRAPQGRNALRMATPGKHKKARKAPGVPA